MRVCRNKTYTNQTKYAQYPNLMLRFHTASMCFVFFFKYIYFFSWNRNKIKKKARDVLSIWRETQRVSSHYTFVCVLFLFFAKKRVGECIKWKKQKYTEKYECAYLFSSLRIREKKAVVMDDGIKGGKSIRFHCCCIQR